MSNPKFNGTDRKSGSHLSHLYPAWTGGIVLPLHDYHVLR
jgi:hypothetical protein